MKCPLTFKTHYYPEKAVAIRGGDCLKEECAWWFRENSGCSVLTLAQGSTYIHKVLLSMEKKMPHARQFLK